MKRLFSVIAILMTVCVLASCGGSSKKTDALAVGKQLEKEAAGFPEMKTITSLDKDADINFTTLCDMDYDRVSSYYYSYSSDGTAPEIAVVTLKNADDTAELMDSLKEHVKTREDTMQEYSPDQVEMVRKYILTEQNGTVGLFIGKGVATLEESFEEALK